MVAIESTAKGVTGRADLGAAGYYDDEYVKTPKGWRIKARTVITAQEDGDHHGSRHHCHSAAGRNRPRLVR